MMIFSKKPSKELMKEYNLRREKSNGIQSLKVLAEEYDKDINFFQTVALLFESYNNYQESVIKKEGVKSYEDRLNRLAKESGFESYEDYQQQKAEEKDFGSHADRLRYIAKERGIEIPNNKKPVKKFNKNLESKVEE